MEKGASSSLKQIEKAQTPQGQVHSPKKEQVLRPTESEFWSLFT